MRSGAIQGDTTRPVEGNHPSPERNTMPQPPHEESRRMMPVSADYTTPQARAIHPSAPSRKILSGLTPQQRAQVHQEHHTAWLHHRTQGIGASDASTILGVNPNSSLTRLYAEKTQGYTSPDNPRMRLGREMEDIAVARWVEDTGTSVRRCGLLAHREQPGCAPPPTASPATAPGSKSKPPPGVTTATSGTASPPTTPWPSPNGAWPSPAWSGGTSSCCSVTPESTVPTPWNVTMASSRSWLPGPRSSGMETSCNGAPRLWTAPKPPWKPPASCTDPKPSKPRKSMAGSRPPWHAGAWHVSNPKSKHSRPRNATPRPR